MRKCCVLISDVIPLRSSTKGIFDKAKGNDSSNYRPITCLPLAWKILTGILAEEIYSFFDENMILPEEQKGCRKKSRGTGDLLYIDKMVLKEAKRRKKNLAMAWIDYRKAYDMLLHSWILECLKELWVNEEIRRLLEETMKFWRVELTCAQKYLEKSKSREGYAHILKKFKPGYEFSGSGRGKDQSFSTYG